MIPGLLPIHKDFIDLLQRSCDLEAASVEHSLAATLISLQLGRHESFIEQLLQHSRQLMDVVTHQREMMKGHGVTLPPELTRRCSELRERQELLTHQVASERHLPAIVSSGAQVCVRGVKVSWGFKIKNFFGSYSHASYATCQYFTSFTASCYNATLCPYLQHYDR